jgi:hypothetical protein
MPTKWTARVWTEYRAGNLTRSARDVLLTLHTFRGTGGHCWPSHATLADRAKCCTRTVQRALQHAQCLGLVDWAERRVKAGWRWLQSSNLYRFLSREAPVQPGMQPPRKARAALTDSVPGEVRVSKKAALGELLREATAAPDLLAMRRAVMQAMMGRRL